MEATKLARTTLTTSRALDFFSRKELVAQIGHPPDQWPLIVAKELIDNALDACEEARVAPQITVSVDPSGIRVSNNGPGKRPLLWRAFATMEFAFPVPRHTSAPTAARMATRSTRSWAERSELSEGAKSSHPSSVSLPSITQTSNCESAAIGKTVGCDDQSNAQRDGYESAVQKET